MPKLNPRAFRIMWDTHSVCGIFIGLALFVIFFTGAFTLFHGEILVWEEPTLRASAPSPSDTLSLDALTRPVLQTLSQDGALPYAYLRPPSDHHAEVYLYAPSDSASTAPEQVLVNPASGAWVAGATHTGVSTLIYYLHFFYQLGPWGMYFAGLIGLFMMLAITTGVIIHLHRLVKDFFQFRPRKKLRVAWADAHKVLGTIGLPFQAMYALTGTFYCLLIVVVLPYTMLLYDGNITELYREAGYSGPPIEVDSVEADAGRASLDELIVRAEQTWPDFEPEFLRLYNVYAANARVEVVGRLRSETFSATGLLVYHGVTGEELARRDPRQASTLNTVAHAIGVLHFAEFGGIVLRMVFFFLALASCAVILTGNFTWLEVRQGQDRTVNRILARLTAGVATGMVPAMALLFLADRLLPQSLADPAWWQNLVFFGSWLLTVIYALAWRDVARTHRALLMLGGVLALLIPVANGLTTGDWPWVTWGTGLGAVLGVDLGAFLCGLTALGLAACLDVDANAPSPPSDATPQANGQQRPTPSMPKPRVAKTA